MVGGGVNFQDSREGGFWAWPPPPVHTYKILASSKALMNPPASPNARHTKFASPCDSGERAKVYKRNEAIYHFAFCFTCFVVSLYLCFLFFYSSFHSLHSADGCNAARYFASPLLLHTRRTAESTCQHTRTNGVHVPPFAHFHSVSFPPVCASLFRRCDVPFFIFVSYPRGGSVCTAEKCNFIYEFKTFIFLADSFSLVPFALLLLFFFSSLFFTLTSFLAISLPVCVTARAFLSF